MKNSQVYLLDVNALIAFLWPAHAKFHEINDWWRDENSPNWATCPFTESGFVRLLSNPVAFPEGLTPSEAAGLLADATKVRQHQFWQANLPIAEALRPYGSRIRGNKQITDAYLLTLATNNHGKLLTFDRGVLSMLEHQNARQASIQLL